MLESLRIENFKAIQNKPLELKGLTNVNYLVGKNGSGKSSVLEWVFLASLSQISDSFLNPNSVLRAYFDLESILNVSTTISAGINKVEVADVVYICSNLSITGSSDNFGNTNLAIPDQKFWSLATYLYNSKIILLDNILPLIRSIDIGKKELLDSHILKNNVNSLPELDFINKSLSSVFKSLRKSENKLIRDIAEEVDFGKINNTEGEVRDPKTKEYIELNRLASGKQILYKLILSLSILPHLKHQPKKYFKYILIEEPETNLHPELQKIVPVLLNEILPIIEDQNNQKVKFLISTHSPFIMSAAAEIAEKEFIKEKLSQPDLNRDQFHPSQKVYQIEGGQSINKKGLWGYRSIQTSARMLGAGLDSMILNDQRHISKNIFYCEGSIDAQIYGFIFPQHNGKHNVFIPCGGAQQTLLNYFINSETNKITMGINTDTLCLVDRSCKDGIHFGTEHIQHNKDNWFSDEDRTKFLEFDLNHRMLEKREIENYLFDPKVVEKFNENKTDNDKINLKITNYDLEVKDNLNKWKDDNKTYINLAEIIRDMKKDQKNYIKFEKDQPDQNNIYWQLYNCIFGEV